MPEKEENQKAEYKRLKKKDSEEKRKFLYEKGKKGPRGASWDNDENKDEETNRKGKHEAKKKSVREKKIEKKKEELKEKAAEKVGAYFMLPPFLSRFIYHHKVLSFVLFVVIPLFALIFLVVFFVTLFS